MTEGTTMPAEREAIVRYIRQLEREACMAAAKNQNTGSIVTTGANYYLSAHLSRIANAISRGDHLKESTHE